MRDVKWSSYQLLVADDPKRQGERRQMFQYNLRRLGHQHVVKTISSCNRAPDSTARCLDGIGRITQTAITSGKERSVTAVDKAADRLPSVTRRCREASRSRLGSLAGGEVRWRRIGRRGRS